MTIALETRIPSSLAISVLESLRANSLKWIISSPSLRKHYADAEAEE